MRLHRFYVLQPLGEEVVIHDVSLIKQWAKVFRYTKGDFVILFDGLGSDGTYSIDTISLKECTLLRTKIVPSYIPQKKVTLYVSLLKKDIMELVVQKTTELGVSTIVPIVGERSLYKNLNAERLNKIAIESSEQCGRGDIPTILPTMLLSEVLGTESPHEATYFFNMDGAHFGNDSVRENFKMAKNIGLFVGPEGGWSKNEEKLFADKKVKAISLGNTVLRAETAAIIASFVPFL